MSDGIAEAPVFTIGSLLETLGRYEALLRVHRDSLNAVNVFPVADGDTGDNLYHTVHALTDLGSVTGEVLAERAITVARGASGMIFSWALRGMCRELDGGVVATPQELAGLYRSAATAAYKAVEDPVEGTILTVARRAAEAANAGAQEAGSTVIISETARRAAWDAVADTPNQLPVLEAAGVVDSGGTGYALFLDALTQTVGGNVPPMSPELLQAPARPDSPRWGGRYELVVSLADLENDFASLARELETLGTNRAGGVIGGLWRGHLHTDQPEAVIDLLGRHGRIERLELTDLDSPADDARQLLGVATSADEIPQLLGASLPHIILGSDGEALQQVTDDLQESVQVVVASPAAAEVLHDMITEDRSVRVLE